MKTDEKTNEITVIPELLELMDLKGILLILLKMCKRQVKRLKSTLGIENNYEFNQTSSGTGTSTANKEKSLNETKTRSLYD